MSTRTNKANEAQEPYNERKAGKRRALPTSQWHRPGHYLVASSLPRSQASRISRTLAERGESVSPQSAASRRSPTDTASSPVMTTNGHSGLSTRHQSGQRRPGMGLARAEGRTRRLSCLRPPRQGSRASLPAIPPASTATSLKCRRPGPRDALSTRDSVKKGS
jgi:hypothetical protein